MEIEINFLSYLQQADIVGELSGIIIRMSWKEEIVIHF